MVRDDRGMHCVYPLDGLLSVLGRKWTIPIVAAIWNAPGVRFGDLAEELGDVTPRVLTDRLRQLEGLDLVERSEDGYRSKVTYALTDEGRQMLTNLLPLLKWAEDWAGAQDKIRQERPPN